MGCPHLVSLQSSPPCPFAQWMRPRLPQVPPGPNRTWAFQVINVTSINTIMSFHDHVININICIKYIYIYIYIYYVYIIMYIYICIIYIYTYTHTGTDRIMEKKNVSIYRRRLSMIEKLRTFFFPYVFFHNYFFFHNSVGDCMSIDSQFECILRGNIEL